ncbi:MAG: peptidoglycan bridge formation glycyltransferase FemA/FemB family protein, partial [Candidatus Doudnabacteria bacterium]
MQIFKTTSKEQQDLYEQFVSTHPQGSFLQSPTWGNFQSTLNQEVARYIITDQNTVILTAQFILKTAPVIKKHYLYCPYGPLFSPAAMQSQQDLVKLLLAQLKKDFPQSILTRFEPKETINLTNSIKTLRTQPAKTFVTFLGQTQEQLLSNMHQKTRYNIKVAQRHQVSVKQINWDDKAELVPCIKLLEKTAERQEFKDFPERYYLKM